MSIPPPPGSGKSKGKGAPPPPDDTPGALDLTVLEPPATPAASVGPKHRSVIRTVPLNFTVERALRRNFARVAFEQECHQVEILEALADLFLDDPRLLAEVGARRDRRRKVLD